MLDHNSKSLQSKSQQKKLLNDTAQRERRKYVRQNVYTKTFPNRALIGASAIDNAVPCMKLGPILLNDVQRSAGSNLRPGFNAMRYGLNQLVVDRSALQKRVPVDYLKKMDDDGLSVRAWKVTVC